jgi:hypothetical protein
VILGPSNTTDAAKASADEASHLANIGHQKHLLLVSPAAFVDEEKLRQSLSQHWVVHSFKGALRAREALLIGVRPEVLVIDLSSEHEAMLGLIERIKRSADPKINAMEVVAYRCTSGPIKDRAVAFGISAFIENTQGLLPFLGVNLEVANENTQKPRVPEYLSNETTAPQSTLNQSILAWVRNQANRSNEPAEIASRERSLANSGLLLHGKLFFHQTVPPKAQVNEQVSNEPPARSAQASRPLRLALLKQQLRAGDELMADDHGQFWLSLRTDNELKAIRVALRLAVALTRSSDPRHFVVGVALSGAYLGDDASTAMQICQDTLPDIEPSGQLAVAVDRWKFSMPLLVAQALV